MPSLGEEIFGVRGLARDESLASLQEGLDFRPTRDPLVAVSGDSVQVGGVVEERSDLDELFQLGGAPGSR